MPPNTSFYYHVAYVWVAAVYTFYAGTLIVRARRARARLDRSTAAPGAR